jgi:uncharacterized protein YjiS (DUF1127 family)
MRTGQTNLPPEVARDGAGPGVDRAITSLLKRSWRAFVQWRHQQSLQATLHGLSERELTDIGVTRGEIEYLTRRGTIDTLRDNKAYLWILSRGVM